MLAMPFIFTCTAVEQGRSYSFLLWFSPCNHTWEQLCVMYCKNRYMYLFLIDNHSHIIPLIINGSRVHGDWNVALYYMEFWKLCPENDRSLVFWPASSVVSLQLISLLLTVRCFSIKTSILLKAGLCFRMSELPENWAPEKWEHQIAL